MSANSVEPDVMRTQAGNLEDAAGAYGKALTSMQEAIQDLNATSLQSATGAAAVRKMDETHQQGVRVQKNMVGASEVLRAHANDMESSQAESAARADGA